MNEQPDFAYNPQNTDATQPSNNASEASQPSIPFSGEALESPSDPTVSSPTSETRSLGYEVSPGHIAATEAFSDYGTLQAPFAAVLEQHPTVSELKPTTVDRIYNSELPQSAQSLKDWVGPQVLQGIQRRIDKGARRWREFSESNNLEDPNWREDQAKFESFVRNAAWAIKMQNEIDEVRSKLSFMAGIRMW